MSSRSVEPGQRFMVRYRVTNAVKISLLPMQQLLDPTVDSIQIEAPEQPGTYKYQISAVNASGSAVQSREIAVSVSFQPKAVIRSFVAEPEQVDEAVAKTTLKWATRDAEKCELKVGGQLIPLPTVNGQMEIDVFQSGTVELIAYDARGLTVRRSVRIRLVKSTPPPPVDDANKTNPPPVTDEQKTAPPPTASGGSAPPPR